MTQNNLFYFVYSRKLHFRLEFKHGCDYSCNFSPFYYGLKCRVSIAGYQTQKEFTFQNFWYNSISIYFLHFAASTKCV